MTDPNPTPDAPAPDLRAEIVRLIREEYDPEPESLYLPHGEWADNAGGVADKIIAALRAERDEAQPVADLAAYDAGILSGFGGGNVEWWQDYIRAELERAHDFYQSQVNGGAHPPATGPGAFDACADCAALVGHETPCVVPYDPPPKATAANAASPGAVGDADLEEAWHTIQAQSDQIDTLLFRLDAEEGQATGWECRDYADGWIKFDTAAAAKTYQAETGALMRVTYMALPDDFARPSPAAAAGMVAAAIRAGKP